MRSRNDGLPGGLPRPGERGIVPRRSGYQGWWAKPSRKSPRRESTLGKILRATVHRRPRQLRDGRKDYPKVCLSGVRLEDAGFLTGKRYEVEVSEGQLVLRTV